MPNAQESSTPQIDRPTATGSKSRPKANKEDRNSELPPMPIPSVSDGADADSEIHQAADEMPLSERIRRRAYELYLARGAGDGDDMLDWLEAERDVHFEHGPGRQQQSAGEL
jgi:DUF2934 family protein